MVQRRTRHLGVQRAASGRAVSQENLSARVNVAPSATRSRCVYIRTNAFGRATVYTRNRQKIHRQRALSQRNCCVQLAETAHKLGDVAVALRIFFSICLIAVFFAGLYILRQRKRFFGRDPQVTTDTWASRNLRLWQVLLVWILAMELLIGMLFRV